MHVGQIWHGHRKLTIQYCALQRYTLAYSSWVECLHPMEELNVVSVVTSLGKKVVEILSQHNLHVKILEHTGKSNHTRLINHTKSI